MTGPITCAPTATPPYRAQRIAQRLAELSPFQPSDAAAIHADTLSPHAALFRSRIAALSTPESRAARAMRDVIMGWDGHMDAESVGATAYNAVRRALTRLLAQRSGLDKAANTQWAAVSPGVSPQGQLWWVLPALLRQDDTALLGGWSWGQALGAALEAASGETAAWGAVHQPRFSHPLSSHFPDHAHTLNPGSRPVSGDGDCVLATGLVPGAGPVATYGALSRYVFDVGDWANCQWGGFPRRIRTPPPAPITPTRMNRGRAAPWCRCSTTGNRSNGSPKRRSRCCRQLRSSKIPQPPTINCHPGT